MMVSSAAKTPDAYLASLPADRRQAMSAVRDVVRANLPPGYEEGMHFGMIGWVVPLERFPVYGDPETERWFRERFGASGKRLDMGQSCVHFRRLEDLPLDVIGETIARVPVDRYLEHYAAARGSARKTRAACRSGMP